MAKLLLEHGANPNAKDEDGKTPLDLWPKLVKIVKEVEAEKTKLPMFDQPLSH